MPESPPQALRYRAVLRQLIIAHPKNIALQHHNQHDATSHGAYIRWERTHQARRMKLTALGELQLSKEDEAAAGGEEQEVRREDQDKINKFSRLHQKEMSIEEELKAKHVRAEQLRDKYSSVYEHEQHTDDSVAEREGGR